MPNIEDLRTHLFDALKGLKDKSMDIERARAIADVGRVLVDSAKVEVDFLRTTGALKSTAFLPDGDEDPKKLAPAGPRAIGGRS